MNDYPPFSVLIANYNNTSYLKETVDSIFKQTYQNWEIIIVDDCSTEDLSEIYKELTSNPKIKIFYNEDNKGVGFTKRKCIELASGDICGFVDPDDAIVPNALEIMVQEHLKYPKAGLVYSEAYYCDEFLNVDESLSIERHKPIKEKSYLFECDYVVGHFATFKRAKYLETLGMNPKYRRAVDQDLYYLLEEVSDLIYINQFLYLYRIHGKGLSSVGDNTLKAFAWHMSVVIDTCRRRNLSYDDIIAQKIAFHIGYPAQIGKVQQELNQIKQSSSYRIGRMIAKILYPIKRLFE